MRAALVLVFATAACAQSFDVTSVKLHPNCPPVRSGTPPTPGHLTINCVPVRMLITAAFGSFDGTTLRTSRMEVLGGPAWLDTDRYDVSATSKEPASTAQMMGPMLRTLLEERFSLKLRKEARMKPVYALNVAGGGAKLRASAKGSCTPLDLNRVPGRVEDIEPETHSCGTGGRVVIPGRNVVAEWWSVTTAELAGRVLPPYVDRPVVDNTGLSGMYDVRLEFSWNQTGGAAILNGVEVPAEDRTPGADELSIYSAVEKQLGLKLSPDKRPIDVLVIDSIDRPTEN